MKSTKSFVTALLFAAALSSPRLADAQVGYPPERSPFRDLEYRHELTLFGGTFSAGKDPAGVAPQGGPMLGLRYELRVGGPAYLMVRAAYVSSERRALDPSEPAATRDLGVHSSPLQIIDAGVSVNLTGNKRWKRLVPTINGGIGVVAGGKDVAEDPYRFGTPFAITLGAGLRYVPGGRFAMRLGADSYLYRLQYPTAYYATASDGTAVLGPRQSTNFWKNNVALTIGASYLFFR
ncbi:MAG TPA: hypothetical protein VMY38_07110 [Gemmatimonadaceae bacterium]|nr:hypothetical protein [Gemmatimonadaceae bacterium]